MRESDLNPQQREAVEHPGGPLLVLAGAGSGKTKTLTHRIAYLIEQHELPPQQILAVTFTNKAAHEMRSRIARMLGRDVYDRTFMPYLGTFHSVCVRMLREEADTIGLYRQFTIFDAQDSLQAVKQIMREMGVDEKQVKPTAVRGLISSAKNELLDPQQYQALASGEAQRVAAAVYPQYQQLLRRSDGLDFDDLLLETVKMLGHKNVLQRWQGQFRHILIDEYQDTNQAQYQLIKRLGQEHTNVCAVGDDWQSVYSWRGANFRNILDFTTDYPHAKIVKLEQNYRSTQPIVTAAQSVIYRNQERSEKQLWTERQDGMPVQHHQADSDRDESRLVTDLLRQSSYDYRDMAVLYRTNAQSRLLEEACIYYGIPYQIVGGTKFYDRAEIKDMLAFVRLASGLNDTISFRRIANIPARGVGAKTLQQFLTWQTQQQIGLLQALREAEQSGVSGKALRGLQALEHLIATASGKTDTPGDLVQYIFTASGYQTYLDDGTPQGNERIENVEELVNVASQYPGTTSFLEEVALMTDVDNLQDDSGAVTLMTLHAAKGLEFRWVCLVGLEEGVFPHSRSLYDQEAMEEERRLCYVGMTRAMDELHITHARSRMLYGKLMHNPPSRFISEIDGATTSQYAQVTENQPVQPVSLSSGDRVMHPMFGSGIVEEVLGSEVTVRFEHVGKKKLLREHAPLTIEE